MKDGGADRVRTCDLLNAIQALYQLSYDPIRSEENTKSWEEIVKVIFAQVNSHFGCRVEEFSIS